MSLSFLLFRPFFCVTLLLWCYIVLWPPPHQPPPPSPPHCISVLVFSHIFSRKIVIVFHRSVIASVGVDESTDGRSRCHGTGAEQMHSLCGHTKRCTVHTLPKPNIRRASFRSFRWLSANRRELHIQTFFFFNFMCKMQLCAPATHTHTYKTQANEEP